MSRKACGKIEQRCMLLAMFIGCLYILLLLYRTSGQDAENISLAEPLEKTVGLTVGVASIAAAHGEPVKKSFTVDGNTFLKDGVPFSFRAGTAHYWRRPPEYWEDTMIKIKALGLNAAQTYISWNLHEPEPEVYDFDGALDFLEYFRLAQKHGLLVIVRPGPFINAEVDKGGFPYWLPVDKQLRTHGPDYFQYVERWFRLLLPKLKNLLYVNGGPIILVQIENEYGSYHVCDRKYREALRDLNRELLGPDVLLYTTDGPRPDRIACGRVDGAVTTVDWGAGSETREILKVFRHSVPVGPFANSEFYPGWINHWSRDWNTVPYERVVISTEEIIHLNASFTLYPVVGGTNFGFTVGSNVYNGTFLPGTTSYDFDAPITEAGDLTEKYWQIRDLMKKYSSAPLPDPPAPSTKGKYGAVKMKFSGSIFTNLHRLCPGGPVKSENPLTFEDLKHPYGLVLYRAVVTGKFRDPAALSIPHLGDRATIFVDKKLVGVVSRTSGLTAVNIFIKSGQVLDILVQNEGRITVGNMTGDFKGIVGPVTLQNKTLLTWEHYPISLPSYPVRKPVPLPLDTEASASDYKANLPTFFTGSFQSGAARDTFLRLDNWHQGYAFVNGFNLGRYWPAEGPQMTLFVPGVFLNNAGDNVLQLLEMTESPCLDASACLAELVDTPVYEPQTLFERESINADTLIKKYGV